MKTKKTSKTGDPIQNRYKKKPHGDSKKRSVPCGTEVTAELKMKQMKLLSKIINFRKS